MVLGASAKPERYSNRAVQMLLDYGHTPIPVHPSGKPVCGITTIPDIDQVKDQVDTISLYLGAEKSSSLVEKILKLKPNRIIMNPGAENYELKRTLEQNQIEVIEGCTLVMLKTGTF